MKLNTIKQRIQEVESQVDIQSLRFREFNPWPLIRLMLAEKLLYQQHDIRQTGVAEAKKGKLKKLEELIRFLILFLKYKSPYKHYDIVLFARNQDVVKDEKGQWVNKFTDSLHHFLDKKYRILSLRYNENAFVKRQAAKEISRNSVSFDFFLKWARLQSDVNKWLKKTIEVDEAERLIKLFDEHALDYEVFIRQLHYIDILARQLENKLSSYRPKLVGFACFYSVDNMAMSLACHRLGIPCMDIQHGIQNDQHLFYTGWDNIPAKGFELIPSLFWTWGATNRDRIRQWTNNSITHDAFIGGNLWLAWKKETAKNYYVEFPQSGKPKVLISLQGNRILPAFVLDYFEKNNENFTLLCRDHPRHKVDGAIKKRIEKIVKVPIETVSEWPLYSLLNTIDIHLTGFSTVAFEAHTFGKPTIFFSLNALNGFGALIEKDDFFCYVNSYNSLSEAMANYTSDSLLWKNSHVESVIQIDPSAAENAVRRYLNIVVEGKEEGF